MNFRVGQKVVCVDDEQINPSDSARIEKDAVYTVRAVGPTVSGQPGVRLEEKQLTSPPGYIGTFSKKPFRDAFYLASRFRPVVERKTDISIFTKMLTDTRITERV